MIQAAHGLVRGLVGSPCLANQLWRVSMNCAASGSTRTDPEEQKRFCREIQHQASRDVPYPAGRILLCLDQPQ
jgi:hypothetical protein